MSMEISGADVGSGVPYVSLASLLTTYPVNPEELLPAPSVIPRRSQRRVDAGANFSRNVRRALHERF